METAPFIAVSALRNGRSHRKPSLLTLMELEASARPSVAYLVSEYHRVPPHYLLLLPWEPWGTWLLRWKRSRRINRSHPHCLTLEIVCYPSSGFSNPASTLPTSWALLPLASNACTLQQRFCPEFVGTEGRGHLSNSDWLGIADR